MSTISEQCGGNIKKESARSTIYTKTPHVALHCATPSCPSWVWLRKTDTLSNCAMCGLLWAKSFHSNGVYLRNWGQGLPHSVRFHGKYDLAPGSGGSSGLVLGNFPWVYDHPWILCGPMGRRKMLSPQNWHYIFAAVQPRLGICLRRLHAQCP